MSNKSRTTAKLGPLVITFLLCSGMSLRLQRLSRPGAVSSIHCDRLPLMWFQLGQTPSGAEKSSLSSQRTWLRVLSKSWESSDGTLRALAILLALETHPVSSTLLIEEPEQNLHPWAIRSLMEHIREVISDRDLQVILATHSPQVLERLEPHELLVASRSAEEGTRFRTLQEILPNAKLAMGDVAQLWVKGLLGGTPGDD